VLPVDVPAFLRSLLPRPADDGYRYLAEHSYEMGAGFKAAIVQTDAVEIRALPRGVVFYDREPVFTVTGPSALVSWLEPLVLMLHYRIQVASRAEEIRVVTCERHRELVRETLDAVSLPAPAIKVDFDGYRGKESIPGRPVLWRRMQGGGPTGIIGQEGETAPAGYEAWSAAPADPKYALAFSPETQALQTRLRKTR
jgi:hypothetical protein